MTWGLYRFRLHQLAREFNLRLEERVGERMHIIETIPAFVWTASADGHNPLCGDNVTVYIKTNGDVVDAVSFEGSGCAISTASWTGICRTTAPPPSRAL